MSIEGMLIEARATATEVIVDLNRQYLPAAIGIPTEIEPGSHVVLVLPGSTTNVPWKFIEAVR